MQMILHVIYMYFFPNSNDFFFFFFFGFILQGFKFVTHWEVVQGREWEHYSFQRLEKSTQIEWCWHSLFSHPQRCLTLLLNLITPHSLFTSSLKMQMSVWFWTMRLFMTSASEHSSSPLLAVSLSLLYALSIWLYPNVLFKKWNEV